MKILVDGYGSIGKRHEVNLEVLGYQDITLLRRSKTGDEKYPVINSYKEISEKPDLIFICNPSALHLESYLQARQLQSHIFMEKPFVSSAEQLKKVEKIKPDNKVFFIGFMLRFHKSILKIKKFITENKIGRVFAAQFHFGFCLSQWQPGKDFQTSYAANADLGGGVINTISHETDLIQFFFGQPDFVFCSASNYQILKINAEETATALFQYKDKLVTMHLDYLQKEYYRLIRIEGELGVIEWNWKTNEIQLITSGNIEIYKADEIFHVNDLYIDELKELFRLIENQQYHHALDFSHACMNAKILSALHKSSQTLKPIFL